MGPRRRRWIVQDDHCCENFAKEAGFGTNSACYQCLNGSAKGRQNRNERNVKSVMSVGANKVPWISKSATLFETLLPYTNL